MAIIGQGVQAGLGRVDYTPYLQGAMAGAQGIAQGIAGLGKSTADAIQEYQKNKAANEILEAENTRYLAYMEKNPEMKGYAPDPSVIDKFRDKMLKGGLTLTDNRKLNAELNVAIKLSDRDREQKRQQAYMDQVVQSTNKMKFDLEQAQRERSALDQFNTTLAQFGKDELTPDKIFETGIQLGTPTSIVNAAVGGRLDIGKYELSKKVNEANIQKDLIEKQKLELELARIKQANPGATIVEVDGNRVWKFVDQSGKVSYDPIKEPNVKPTTMQQLSSIVQMYKAGVASKDQVMINAAITDFAEATGKKGSVWTLDAIGDELANFANKVPNTYAPPAGGAGIRSVRPVQVEQKAPGAAAAPAAPSKQEAPVKTAGGQAVAQPNLPPQPQAPYTPPAAVAAAGDAGLNAWLATIGANRDPNAVPNPRGELTSEYAANLVASAPPPTVVDTNLVVDPSLFRATTPAQASQYGDEMAGMRTSFGQISPIARFIQRATEVNPEVANRRAELAAQLQTDGQYAAAGPFSRSGGALGAMGRYLSGDNMAAETLRVMGAPFGAMPEQGNAPLPSQTTNLPSATLDAMAAPLESVPAARERMRREDAAIKTQKRLAEEERNRPAPPMKSAELPQITLSKDAKRIADLLLQEYENNKGGKAPTFTITASRPGGKETTVKLSNPAILAIMSNPTNFGGMIRGNVEQFSQQNARMNQILAEMEAARAARTRTVRGR